MPPTTSPSSQLTGLLSGSSSSADLGSLASGALGTKSKGALYVAILGSRTVQDAIINRFDLRKVYHVPYMKDARKALATRTAADEATKSGIITLTVTDRDRNRAAEIAAAYVQELNRVSVENNDTSAHLERVFLEHRLAEVNQDLKDSTAKLAQFSSKSMTFDAATQGKAMMDAGADLQAKLIASEAELSGLRQSYTDTNPRVIALQATVEELRKQLNNMGSGTGSAGNSSQIYPSLRELPLLGATYEDLYRHAKVEEAVADLLTRQYEVAKVDEAKELPVVQMLDPPDIAEKRSSPRRGTIDVVSVPFYFSLGIFFILLETYWKRLEPTDPKRMLATELNGYWRQLFSRRSTNSSHQA
jgi:uncharacterized protein involved in exopolysaccharide biosynthesis